MFAELPKLALNLRGDEAAVVEFKAAAEVYAPATAISRKQIKI